MIIRCYYLKEGEKKPEVGKKEFFYETPASVKKMYAGMSYVIANEELAENELNVIDHSCLSQDGHSFKVDHEKLLQAAEKYAKGKTDQLDKLVFEPVKNAVIADGYTKICYKIRNIDTTSKFHGLFLSYQGGKYRRFAKEGKTFSRRAMNCFITRHGMQDDCEVVEIGLYEIGVLAAQQVKNGLPKEN